jgi:putative lipoprotein
MAGGPAATKSARGVSMQFGIAKGGGLSLSPGDVKNKSIQLSGFALVLALAAGCASHKHHSTPGQATISGTVVYPGTLPADASLAVYLVENTEVTGTVEVLANATLDFRNGSPVAYTIRYNPAEVEPSNRYTIGARVTNPAGEVILKSNGYLVLTKGGPSDNVTITLSSPR